MCILAHLVKKKEKKTHTPQLFVSKETKRKRGERGAKKQSPQAIINKSWRHYENAWVGEK